MVSQSGIVPNAPVGLRLPSAAPGRQRHRAAMPLRRTSPTARQAFKTFTANTRIFQGRRMVCSNRRWLGVRGWKNFGTHRDTPRSTPRHAAAAGLVAPAAFSQTVFFANAFNPMESTKKWLHLFFVFLLLTSNAPIRCWGKLFLPHLLVKQNKQKTNNIGGTDEV